MLFLSGGLTPGPLFLNGRTMTSQSLCSPWEQVAFFRLRYFLNRRSVSVLLHQANVPAQELKLLRHAIALGSTAHATA